MALIRLAFVEHDRLLQLGFGACGNTHDQRASPEAPLEVGWRLLWYATERSISCQSAMNGIRWLAHGEEGNSRPPAQGCPNHGGALNDNT
jgi:hypothetical protein